jgi:hypothetical protein
MATSIAELFIDELSGWKDTIDYYFEEIEEFEKKLSSLIRRNTIPRLAENAELFLNRFLLQRQNCILLNSQIDNIQAKLLTDTMPVSNELVTDQIKIEQTSLREKMQKTEKDYIDLKFRCENFFSEIFGK